jgi:hypothetical protein
MMRNCGDAPPLDRLLEQRKTVRYRVGIASGGRRQGRRLPRQAEGQWRPEPRRGGGVRRSSPAGTTHSGWEKEVTMKKKKEGHYNNSESLSKNQ